MFLDVLIISIILIGLAILGMSLNILVKKKGKFPEFRVGHNRNMAKKGISCVKHEEIRCFKAQLKEKEDCAGCQQLS